MLSQQAYVSIQHWRGHIHLNNIPAFWDFIFFLKKHCILINYLCLWAVEGKVQKGCSEAQNLDHFAISIATRRY